MKIEEIILKRENTVEIKLDVKLFGGREIGKNKIINMKITLTPFL